MPVQTLRLPLRGLASEGAEDIVAKALAGVPGIASIRASMVNNLLEVDYDDARVSEKVIHDALERAGIAHAAHGETERAKRIRR